MKKIALLVFLIPCLLTAAGPVLRMGKFLLPEYDANGAMIRRLASESATGPMEEPVLGPGVLEIFAQREGRSETVARLEFTEATFTRASSTIHGPGEVHFRSAQGEVWGTGFSYDLTTGELRLDSKVAIKLPQGLIHAAKGEVKIDPKSDAAGNIVIRRADLTGGVTVTELTDKKLGMDKIEAARATYDAADGLLRVPAPVKFWRGQETGNLESSGIVAEVGPVVLPADGAKPKSP